MATEKPTVAVTMGDPAGIGAEVIVKGYDTANQYADLVVVGDASVVEHAIDVCDSSFDIDVVDDVSAASEDEEGSDGPGGGLADHDDGGAGGGGGGYPWAIGH